MQSGAAWNLGDVMGIIRIGGPHEVHHIFCLEMPCDVVSYVSGTFGAWRLITVSDFFAFCRYPVPPITYFGSMVIFTSKSPHTP